MKLIRIIKSIRRLLFINKLRVVLSLIGITVGITSVIIMTALGEGARNKMLSQIEAMGSNLITIDAGKIKEVIGRKRQTQKVNTLKLKDSDALIEECGSIDKIAPTQDQAFLIKYGNGGTNCRVIGTTPDYPAIRNFKIDYGRFFTEEENKISARAAIVGTKVVDNLFYKANPIGEFIRINNVPFEIIGVLQKKGSSYDGADEDEVIFIPIQTGMRRLFNVDYIKNIYMHVKDKSKMKSAEDEIRELLRERHRLNLRDKEDDFTIQNMYTTLKAENETSSSFTFLISGVAGLSLLVGGVGILAMMLLSVKERTPEIGLRMAVGAKPNDILIQFLLEATILSSVGGTLGVIAGAAGTSLINHFTDFNALITEQSIFVSVIISCFIGIFFGAYPARRASLTQPIKALRG
ncbi:MAG: ABC transporter permease [Ignavibacteriales bacterium]|nr:ABC transporter permease [Ignavibacteriales bacterium]